ncbi:MAG: class I SAM-dependent RNA methyltransferase [Pseudomonadota bacterium]
MTRPTEPAQGFAPPFALFLVCPPGLEPHLAAEAAALGLEDVAASAGGVTATGGWQAVWRANLHLRGAVRVMVRLAAFRALHLAQLDKRLRRLPWRTLIEQGSTIHIEAQCKRSRIYHAGAAAERLARALSEEAGAAPVRSRAEATLGLRLLIDDDLCAVSLDSSGEPLYRRGHKFAVAKAPMRESMAALFLRAAGFDGVEPVLDPMCGAGTFVLEAAGIAAGQPAGHSRGFAFEALNGHDARAFAAFRAAAAHASPPQSDGPPRFIGSDRDAGAVAMASENAARAGLAARTLFLRRAVSEIAPPEGLPPGLVIANPPYGARIGEGAKLGPLHAALGAALRERFRGWRAAIVTTEEGLARATGLPFLPPGPPVPHGGLRVKLWQTEPLR